MVVVEREGQRPPGLPEKIGRFSLIIPENRVNTEFSDAQTNLLGLKNRAVITLEGGRSIKSYGKQIWTNWHRYRDGHDSDGCKNFEDSQSLRSEVAVNRYPAFLPKGIRKPLCEMERMVVDFSKSISREVPGTEAIMGNFPDYVELFRNFLHIEGKPLVCEGQYVGTKTRIGNQFVVVGYPEDPSKGLAVLTRNVNIGYADVHVVPLIVPSGK